MIEIELNGNTYRLRKLDAFGQFHVSRKIAPIIPTLIPMFLKISRSGVSLDMEEFGELFQPFADGIASMPDEAAEYIMSTCLGAVQRQTSGAWANVWSSAGCMFDDMDLSVLMQLCFRVIKESLGPFMDGLFTSQQSGQDRP